MRLPSPLPYGFAAIRRWSSGRALPARPLH